MQKSKAVGIKNVLESSKKMILEKLKDIQCADQWEQMERQLEEVKKKIREIDDYLI